MTNRPDDEYDEYFRRLFPRAVALGRRVSGDDEAAKDAAVEALARAYAHWPRISKLEWRDGWVLKVTLREALRQTRERPTAQIEQVLRDEADAIVLRQSLIEVLQLLPRRQQEAVALRYLADLSEREVASALGISQGSVKTHLHRGLAALRVAVGRHEGGADDVALV